MNRDLIIVENFYEDPESVVRLAKSTDYFQPYDRCIDPDSPRGRWQSSRWRSSSECPFRTVAVRQIEALELD